MKSVSMYRLNDTVGWIGAETLIPPVFIYSILPFSLGTRKRL
jgi:hypothetical protein